MQKNPQRYVDQIRITNFDMIYMTVTNRAMSKTEKEYKTINKGHVSSYPRKPCNSCLESCARKLCKVKHANLRISAFWLKVI